MRVLLVIALCLASFIAGVLSEAWVRYESDAVFADGNNQTLYHITNSTSRSPRN